jgi:beta-glucanase (GH16 family)
VAVTGVRAGYESVTRESASSAVVTVPVCGTDPPPKADGTPWQCAFADEFDGASLDRTKWMPQQTSVSGIKSGPGCIVDDDDNVSVGGGTLHLTAQREASPFTCSSPNGDSTTEYTNGSVTSFGRFSQSFGRYEFRAKFPDVQVPGLHGALWLYPVVQSYGAWPRSGEIDVAEVYSRYPDRAIPFVHYRMADPDDRTVTNTACKLNPAEFHTYVLEWTLTTITISYDGAQCLKHTIAPAWPMPAPLPFGRPFAVIMTQVQGRDGTNQFVPGLTPLPATTQVDYVHVWK